MKKQFTKEQIIGVLKESEAGGKVAELCRKHGIAEATYYTGHGYYPGLAGLSVRKRRRKRIAPAERVAPNELQTYLDNCSVRKRRDNEPQESEDDGFLLLSIC